MNVLEKIVADKRIEVAQRKIDFPLESFKANLLPSDRDFKAALVNDRKNRGACYIFECKKASPSKGLIRANFDLDEICDAYREFASCVSVLSDEKYFQGEFERLPIVREKLPQPILCKDFFVDTYQVYLARYFGANAVLLMLSVLDDETYQQLADVAKSLGLAILTEVSNEQEMRRAVALKADIVGINNRNLRDLSTDLNQTPKLVSLFQSITDDTQQANTVIISESGIYTHDQVNKLNEWADGYLVGSSLMAQKDLFKACRDLVKGQHKVCGLTSAADAIMVAEQGATFGGLIFVEKSKRCVTPSLAQQIIAETNNQTPLKFVAVVQNMPLNALVDLLKAVPVNAVQLHGDEDQSYINDLKAELDNANLNMEIWQVVSVKTSGELPAQWPTSDRILLDTQDANGQQGGTGQAFDWRGLADLPLDLQPIMLAGGIGIENIEQTKVLPIIGTDLNSRVETQPGSKDKELVTQCFTALFA